MTHSEEIRQRILNAKKPTLIEADEKPTSDKWNMTFILVISIIVISLATFFVLNKKNGLQIPNLPTVSKPSITNNIIPASKADLEAVLANINARMEKSDKRIDVLFNRTWLLGLANNENAAIQQANDLQRFGIANSGYIVFDENWKINKTPNSMQLDEKQKEDLLSQSK